MLSITKKLFLLFVFIAGLQLSYSQNNWDGDNPLGNFTLCNNWFTDTCPATWNSATDLNIQLKNNNSQITMYLDYGTWKDVNNITYFASYNPAVLLNQFDADGPVGSENGINFYGKMENYSPNNGQVFNLPFHGKNATVIEINPMNSGFTFNRPIYNSGNVPFRVYGSNSKKVTLNSYPEGNASVSLTLKQYSIVEVNYNNAASLSGGYFVEEGELWVNSNGVIQGGIQIGNGTVNTTKLYISHASTATTVANAITVPSNSSNASIGALNTSNTHIYSGTVNLNNNIVTFDEFNAGGSVNFTGTISGTGGVRKINSGLVRFSAANTYTGTTTINSGTLQFGIANAIGSSSNVTLNTGTLSTGATTGYSCTVGTLALTDNSTIALGTGTHTLTFAASNAVGWTAAKVLTITGWTNSCTGAKIFVGNSNTGLTAGQLAQITFQGYLPGAGISTTGELIPGNAVLTATGGTLLGNYATLSAAFTAINAGTHTGVVTLTILNDINEGANTATLNNNASMTSLLIQPGGCAARTVTGTGTGGLGTPLIDFNGADVVTVDGLNTGGNSLTISNTSTSNTSGTCTIRFQTDATNNLITNATILGSATMAAGTAGGDIWFGSNSTIAGNDNNTISNCNIGPAGVNLPSKAICFTGTAGLVNDNITINNNNIYDYFGAAVASAGIDLISNSNSVSITNNRFYQTATRTQTTGTTHSGIRIANASGIGYVITGNTIGYSSFSGTGIYDFVGIASSVFNPINISVGTATPTSIQNNTIAGIQHRTSAAGFATVFNAINVTGGGTVNIGNVTGNTIGLAAAPITFTTTGAGAGGTVFGINVNGTGNMALQNNVIQAITTGGIAASAFNFTGINVAGPAAAYTITNNTIGSSAANSISLGNVIGTSTILSTFIGITSSATGNLVVGALGVPNTIQNITFYASANNSFTGISNSGINTSTSIAYNIIKGIRFAAGAGSTLTAITNTAAINGPINITNNSLGNGTNLVTYAIASSGAVRGILNTGAGATANISVSSNYISGISHALASSSPHTYISNTASCPSGHSISSNTIIGLSATSGIIIGIDDSSASASKAISNNTINTLASTGAAVTAINSSNGTTPTINANTISGLSSTSATAGSTVTAINVTGGTTIAITNNPISTISSANDGPFVGIAVNSAPATSTTITGNTISGMTSSSTSTLSSIHVIEVGGTTNSSINSNTISNINSTSTTSSTGIVGIYNGSSGSASTINSNTISGINATTLGNFNVNVAAIVTGNSAAGGTIAKNRIYGLTNTSTGGLNYVIGFVPGGGNWTFANNMISITNNNTVQAIGVFDAGATGTRNYFYNSIYIAGTHAGNQVSNGFQYTYVTGTVVLKNNIFVMNRTSAAKNYAISVSAFTNFTSNYNVFNSSVASTVGYNGSDQTFTSWQTVSAGDANSYTAIPVTFTNTATADLHITSGCSDIESGGTPVAVVDDYDATARSGSTPDIGADEYNGTAPTSVTITPASATFCSGGNVVVTASSADVTYSYSWSPATGLSATTGATVTATPTVTTTYTITATSLSGCIKTKYITVSVNPLPAAITVTPSTVTMCANTIQSFTAAPAIGTAVVGTANANVATVNNTPYRQASSTQLRIQYLMTKAELNAAGFYGGTITALAYNVTVAGTFAMPTYDISLAQTNATVLTTTYITTGFTTVYNGISILPVVGLNTHTFSTPFTWDGSSNIVVNICHTGTGNGLNPFSKVTLCTPATVSTDSRTGGGSCAAATGTTDPDKPVITLTYFNPITWSPVTELYTDAAATIAYNPAVQTNLATVYAKPSVSRTYTASSTITVTGCASTSTGTINMSASTWNGASWSPSAPTGNTSLSFTGNYTSSGNLSGCSCSVTGGNVIISNPDTMTLVNGLTVTAPGTLKFNNNASLLQINDAATNSGTVTFERITQPMYRFDYTYWGCPVTLASNFTLGVFPGGLSPETLSDKFYSWTPTIANAGGNWAQESAATIMNPIKGYIVRAPSTFSFNPATKVTYTANLVGVPNNGVISSPIYHGALALGVNDDKYNLLGNPYPSALDAQAFLTNAANTPIIDGTIYFWTHNSPINVGNPNPFYGTFALNYDNNDYAAWNSLGAAGARGIQAGTGGVTPNGYIATGQGFFTKSTGTAATGATVTFNNSMRVAGNNNQFFRNSIPSAHHHSPNVAADKHRIWLDLISSSGKFSQILVGYLADATLEYDRMYDGVPIDESGMLLYSVIPNRKLIIQGRPLPFDEDDQVTLGFKSNVQDTYSFGLDAVDGLFENHNIYIEDKSLNIIHDLKQSPYQFVAAPGICNDRFVLRYTDAALHNPDFNADQGVIAFVSNHQLHAESTQPIQSIEVYDVSGKWIKTYTPKDKSGIFKAEFNFANGVYLAKIKLENGMVLTKKLLH